MILTDEETDGRRRVTSVETRVERGGCTEIRSLRYVGWEVARTISDGKEFISVYSFIKATEEI